MKLKCNIIRPIQPFFVINTNQYYKKCSDIPGIAHFYKFTGSQNAEQYQAIPDGAIDVIFRCDPDNPSAMICGTVRQCNPAGFESGKTYFGVRLLPGFFDGIGNASVKELMYTKYPIDEVLHDHTLTEQIFQKQDFESQIRIFEQHFLHAVHHESDAGGDITTAILMNIYEHAGIIRIEQLADELHYSRRHLSRCFLQSTGMDIKSFSSYIRFQSVMHRMNDGEFATLSEAAMAGNYYDQTHFQKNFRQYAGITPGAYLRLLHTINYNEKLTVLNP